MIIQILPNSANGPGFEYGQEAASIFGLEYCHKLALAGEILVYDSQPQWYATQALNAVVNIKRKAAHKLTIGDVNRHDQGE
jgi:hypothetical protein